MGRLGDRGAEFPTAQESRPAKGFNNSLCIYNIYTIKSRSYPPPYPWLPILARFCGRLDFCRLAYSCLYPANPRKTPVPPFTYSPNIPLTIPYFVISTCMCLGTGVLEVAGRQGGKGCRRAWGKGRASLQGGDLFNIQTRRHTQARAAHPIFPKVLYTYPFIYIANIENPFNHLHIYHFALAVYFVDTY